MLKIRTYDDPNRIIDLSEAHLLFCGGGSCSGWFFSQALDYLKNNGVPDENCFPYQARNMPCNSTCADWRDRLDYTKINNWSNTLDVNEMKKRIVNNGPQVSGMAVYTDFFYYASGIYLHVWGGLEGYHAITIVGFSDKDNCWICKNSWGTGWGENGWFRMAYGQCYIEDVFGMYDMEVPKRDLVEIRIVDPDVIDAVNVQKIRTRNNAPVESWNLNCGRSTGEVDLKNGTFYLKIVPYIDPLPVWFKVMNKGNSNLTPQCLLSADQTQFKDLMLLESRSSINIPGCLHLEYKIKRA